MDEILFEYSSYNYSFGPTSVYRAIRNNNKQMELNLLGVWGR